MANLTKSQRHNKMLNDTFETYRKQQATKKDLLPTCSEYTFFINKCIDKFKISIDEARNKYCLYTYGQFKELLNLF